MATDFACSRYDNFHEMDRFLYNKVQFTNNICEICIMKILFITAEQPEAEACLRACRETGVDARVVFSGMGAEATESMMAEMLSSGEKYDYVIDAGIAGTFDGSPSGAAFNVIEERHGEAPDTILTGAKPLFGWLPCVSGLTIQVMTEDAGEVERRKALGAQVESMEGASFFQMCHKYGVENFAELRTISNAVGESDRSRWDTGAGIESIYVNCRRFLEGLKK